MGDEHVLKGPEVDQRLNPRQPVCTFRQKGFCIDSGLAAPGSTVTLDWSINHTRLVPGAVTVALNLWEPCPPQRLSSLQIPIQC
jgi:hypothetical protein